MKEPVERAALIGATRKIRFSANFSMPVFTGLIFNAEWNAVYFAVGLTI